jgi:hypothetical protein
MIDEDFFMTLPPDPEEAFPIYERHVREKCLAGADDEDPSSVHERNYINLMLAIIKYYKLDLGFPTEMPPHDGDFWTFYHNACRVIDYHAPQFTLRRLDRIDAFDRHKRAVEPLLLFGGLVGLRFARRTFA